VADGEAICKSVTTSIQSDAADAIVSGQNVPPLHADSHGVPASTVPLLPLVLDDALPVLPLVPLLPLDDPEPVLPPAPLLPLDEPIVEPVLLEDVCVPSAGRQM